MRILYQDNRIIVCEKPVGILSTDEPGGLPELLRAHLGEPNGCVRTVHRLDRVVGGLMVLARSRAAAQILSEQMRNHQFHKTYCAVLCGTELPEQGTLRDLLVRDPVTRRTGVTDTPGKDVREAVLHYSVLACAEQYTLVRIQLETGRTHQIRAQFSSRGFPLAGDRKYGAPETEMEGIALWSVGLAFTHPQTGEEMRFETELPDSWPWSLFTK